MSAPKTDLDAAIARLDAALSAVEMRVRALKARPASAPSDSDLFASGEPARDPALEAAAAEASEALERAAAEIRAVLEEA